ncbi:hypothetical protein BDQ17DRAFT_1356915 [Cyathus striatus]|nr:hypothetical protein BDQ17DRAFT_1356915 [Cyathus striatus]
MPLDTLQIVESPPESFLKPSVVWKYWKEEVIIDHRSYYSTIEYLTVLAIQHMVGYSGHFVLSGEEGLRRCLWIGEGAMLLLGIIPLHWYGNQRRSNHFLTKLASHLVVLISLAISLTACQTIAMISIIYSPCSRRDGCINSIELNMLIIYWLCLIPVVLAFIIVYYGPERKRQRDLDANLGDLQPELEGQESWRSWLLANVADGIDDDYPQEDGELRIGDDEVESESDGSSEGEGASRI